MQLQELTFEAMLFERLALKDMQIIKLIKENDALKARIKELEQGGKNAEKHDS